MRKVLSYIIWNPTEIPTVTKISPFMTQNRYWYNIPYLLIANSFMFSEFYMYFYVHEDSINHPFFVFLREASKRFEKVKIKIINKSYKGLQLCLERMRPLWDEDVEYFFCRDLDYAVSSFERKSMDHFMEQNECSIHSIRAWSGHHRLPIYGGLCGFHVKKIFEKIKNIASTFEEYENFEYKNEELTGHKYQDLSYISSWKWECDQYFHRDFFQYTGLLNQILDCPQLNASERLTCSNEFNPEKVGYHPKICRTHEYAERKIICDQRISNFLDDLFISPSVWRLFTPFVGRSWTCVSDYLKKLISLKDNEMSKMVEKVFVDNFGKVTYDLL